MISKTYTKKSGFVYFRIRCSEFAGAGQWHNSHNFESWILRKREAYSFPEKSYKRQKIIYKKYKNNKNKLYLINYKTHQWNKSIKWSEVKFTKLTQRQWSHFDHPISKFQRLNEGSQRPILYLNQSLYCCVVGYNEGT